MNINFIESAIVRQNVLNNTFAINTLQQTLSLNGVMLESKLTFIKKQVAEFFEVSKRTIGYCLDKNEKEITQNGYEVLRGKRLVNYKLAFLKHFGNEMDFVTKTLLTDSDRVC